ncbi:Sel1-like protein [Corchorus olitorius]|uniref:Sel1-like protein n=1 Tax=Corchorus olitorius TaxID=93759 RepID=A0A1R3JS32_9ROSI|nr:Sel1-like protein [Corchorus olitorius]
MGKSLPSATKLQHLARATAQHLNKTGKYAKPTPQNRRILSEDKSKKKMESSSTSQRVPLSEVVSDCVKRWFKDTLKEAKAGDVNMQVLVGQMYYSGYGVPRDAQKGRIWMTRASRLRSSVWKVSDKHPGYNASDSDSDEMKGES